MAATRRRALLAATAGAVGLAAAGVWFGLRRRGPQRGALPRLADGHPVLRMPFAAGTAVLCQQGNVAREGLTHSAPNCLHALDLSNLAMDAVDVLSSGPGQVVYLFDSAVAGDVEAGSRFGNYVKLDHGDGYFSFYAHLGKVEVRERQLVDTGTKLGQMGMTGAAGNRHLHFSLHRENPIGPGVYQTIPMRALVTADLSGDGEFARRDASSLVAGPDHLWQGNIYGSENDATKPLLSGPATGPLAKKLWAGYQSLRQAIDDRITLRSLAKQWKLRDAAWARAQLEPILARDPDHAVARYWLAAAVHLPSRQWREAEKLLGELLEQRHELPTWEQWLWSACHNRAGQVALHFGRTAEAESHFEKAAKLAATRPVRRFALEQLAQLRSSQTPDGGLDTAAEAGPDAEPSR